MPDPEDVTYYVLWFLDRGITIERALELARRELVLGELLSDEELLVQYGDKCATQESN